MARLGCDVITYEPNLKTSFSESLLDMNGVRERVTLIGQPVSNTVMEVQMDGGQETASFKRSTAAGGSTLQTVRLIDTVPADANIVLAKIDTEGAEILVLEAVLQLIDSGVEVPNIIFECTFKWWGNYGVTAEHGLSVIDRFVNSGYSLYSVLWSQRGIRDGGSPHLTTPDIDWDTVPMHHVQRVPPSKIHEYISSITRQRDFWLHRDDVPLNDQGLKSAWSPIVCADADFYATPLETANQCKDYQA